MAQYDDVTAADDEPAPRPADAPDGNRTWVVAVAGLPALRRLRAAWNWLTTGVWAGLAWLGLTGAASVGMGQISSIVDEVTPTGQYPVSAVTGIGALGSVAAAPHATLNAWDEAGRHFPALGHWLWCYLGMDLLYIAGFAMLGVTVLKKRGHAVTARWLLAAAAAAYAAEAGTGALALTMARPSGTGKGVPDVAAWLLHISTEIKWAVVLTLLAWMAYRVHASYRDNTVSPERRDVAKGIYADIRRLIQALEIQRFSLVVVVLLALMAIGPPLNGTLEQMPDVQRAWLNSGSSAGRWKMLTAACAQLALALMLLSLGRMRTERARAKFAPAHDLDHQDEGEVKDQSQAEAMRHETHSRMKPRLRVWFGLSALIGAAAVVLWLTGGARVSWNRVLACSGVLLIIALVSKVVEHIPSFKAKRTAIPLGRELPGQDGNVVAVARLAGEALAVAVIAVTPLGVVRSFTVPALVIGGLGVRGALVAGVVGSAAIPLACGLLLTFLLRSRQPEENGPVPAPQSRPVQGRKLSQELAGTTIFMWSFGALFVLADVWLILAPLSATHVLGVLATAVIAIGSLASLLGLLAYLAQTRQPLPLFVALRMNVTPVLTIIVVIALVGGIADRNSSLHQVSGPVATGGPDRPSLSAALGRWLHSPLTAACAVPARGAPVVAGHPVRIEPLIQVAASGGGIRAAWWTVKVLGTIASTPCGVHDVFAVSSISGGSMGTAVLASVGTGSRHPVAAADASITAMAGPDALAAGIDGLMLRDTIAGYTGLDLWAAQMPATERYPDRAALMEAVWENEDNVLSRPFPLRHSWLPWALLFNSTSVSTGCRAILSSVTLPHPAGTLIPAEGLSCGLGTSGPAGSYDFFARLRCERNITTATAALLSARYAYITPSGTLDGCGPAARTFDDQLVDGGYGDSSGLSTLVNLAPDIMARVRQYNDGAIASAPRGRPITLVVPVTAYLGNSVQPAETTAVPARTPEFDVPASALSVGPATELTRTDVLLQDIAATTGPSQWVTCGSADAMCADAQAIAQRVVPDQLVMVTPTEYPGVAAPLGWLLSQASQKALDRALRRDVRIRPCGAYRSGYAARDPYCLPGVGGLADLLALTGRNP